MNSTLIVYGTRYGAAARTAEEIAATFRKKGLVVKVADLKQEKIREITAFDLVVVGSGIQINRWTSEPESFLKKHCKELTEKKLAMFVCCGSASAAIGEDKTLRHEMKAKYLEAKAAQYGLQPVALGFFGGIYNYNKRPWWAKKALDSQRPKIAAAYKETEPNVYDTRDVEAIRKWAHDLAQATITG